MERNQKRSLQSPVGHIRERKRVDEFTGNINTVNAARLTCKIGLSNLNFKLFYRLLI